MIISERGPISACTETTRVRQRQAESLSRFDERASGVVFTERTIGDEAAKSECGPIQRVVPRSRLGQ